MRSFENFFRETDADDVGRIMKDGEWWHLATISIEKANAILRDEIKRLKVLQQKEIQEIERVLGMTERVSR